jgi:hypothetical protein
MKLKERIALWFAWRKVLKHVRPWLEKVLGRTLTREELKMKNWKTTLLGILAGLTGGTVAGWTTPDGDINWVAVAFSIITALFGYFSKDHDTTGIGASATKGL